jgi:hypothetical protein
VLADLRDPLANDRISLADNLVHHRRSSCVKLRVIDPRCFSLPAVVTAPIQYEARMTRIATKTCGYMTPISSYSRRR